MTIFEKLSHCLGHTVAAGDNDESNIGEKGRANGAPLSTSATTKEVALSTAAKPVLSYLPLDTAGNEEEKELAALRDLGKDIDRYIYLRNLQEQRTSLFWKLLMHHPTDTMPFVYTPTVGEACQNYCNLPLTTRGIFLTIADKGRILDKLQAWPEKDIRVVVVTDGERILGLGDLGYGGMGISEGKITLYTVIAGVDPKKCLPVCLDVGTNTDAYLQDPQYKGIRKPRLRGPEYDAFIDEFMTALRSLQPHLLLQALHSLPIPEPSWQQRNSLSQGCSKKQVTSK